MEMCIQTVLRFGSDNIIDSPANAKLPIVCKTTLLVLPLLVAPTVSECILSSTKYISSAFLSFLNPTTKPPLTISFFSSFFLKSFLTRKFLFLSIGNLLHLKFFSNSFCVCHLAVPCCPCPILLGV